MNGNSTKFSIAAALWMLSLSLGLAGTIDGDARYRFWALMVALVATLVSGQLIMIQVVREERLRVEHLVEGMIARARDRADLPRIR